MLSVRKINKSLLHLALGLLFLLLFNAAGAQSQFSKRYSFNIPGDVFSSMLISGDTIFMTGTSGDTSQNFAEIQSNKTLYGLFNVNGDDIRHDVYKGDFKKDYANISLIKTSGNSFLLCGTTADSSYILKALLMKFDSVMNVTVVKEFQFPDSINGMNIQNVVQLKDGSFIVAGAIQFPAFYVEIAIMKLDASYNVQWWKTYNSNSLVDRFPAILCPTDSTLLIGYERNNEVYDPRAVVSNTKFMLIDTTGYVLNQWQDNNDSTFAPYGLLKTRDGGYAYCGRFTNRMAAPYDVVLVDGVITKIDSNFQLVWRRVYRGYNIPGSNTILNQLRELPDGSLIATGTNQTWNPIAQLYTPTGWFVKVSSSGDSLWSSMYRGIPGSLNNFDDNQILDFQLLPDGGIIGCGFSTDNSASYLSQQAWLIRLDNMGCLIPGCNGLTPNDIKETGDLVGVKVYPNPANNMVYVLLKTDNDVKNFSFKVYDVNGKLLAQEQYAAPDITYLLNTSRYAKGMYFIEVMSGDVVAARRKFVKE